MARQPSETDNSDKEDNTALGGKVGEGDPSQTKKADASSPSDPLSALRKGHKELTDLLDTINKKTPDRQKDTLQQLKERWLNHSRIEEELLLPQIENRNIKSAELLEAEVRRDLAKLLIANLEADETGEAAGAAKLRVLDGLIRQLVEAEEKPDTGLFARVQSFNIPDLAEKISRRHKEIEQHDADDPVLRHLSVKRLRARSDKQESNVTNRNDDVRRYGRDHEQAYGGGRNERPFRDHDDDRRGGQSRYSSDRDHDEDRRYSGGYDQDYGRDRNQGSRDERPFRDHDDDRRSGQGRYSSGREYDDDRRHSGGYDQDYGRNRNQGGRDERPFRDHDDDRRGGQDRYSPGPGREDDRRYSGGYDQGRDRDRGRGDWDERQFLDYNDAGRGGQGRYSPGRNHDDDRRQGEDRDRGYGRNRDEIGWYR